MQTTRRIGLKKTVSLVILPIDDFTDQIITDAKLRMYIQESQKPSIRKADGYHVFCDLDGEEVHICMEGPLYQKQILRLPLDGETQIFQVRLLPGATYPIPAGSTCLRGTLKPGSRFLLFFPEQKRSFKLLYDYDPQNRNRELSLFQPARSCLDGKLLCIRNKGEQMEFFRVEMQKGEVCRLEEPLSGIYKKIGTSVYPVYEAFAKEDGSLYLPIRSLPGEECRCTCYVEREAVRRFSMVLHAGEDLRITEELLAEMGEE